MIATTLSTPLSWFRSVWPVGVEFAEPWAFSLLVLIPLVHVLSRGFRRPPAATFATPAAAVPLPTTWRTALAPVTPALRWLAAALLIVAIARPQLGTGRVETSTEAVAIQIVMDRSASMAQEMEMGASLVSRIDVVKRTLRQFLLGDRAAEGGLAGRSSDLVGLVTFARFAETNCPLVRDPAALVELADAVPLAVQRYEGGTAIGEGLSLACARLQTAEQELRNRSGGGGVTNTDSVPDLTIKSKVVVLMTDGSNNAGDTDPMEAAAAAAEWGIKVYTIGIGAGAPSYQVTRTPFGEQRVRVPSDVDEPLLQRIAETTGGLYRRAQDADTLRRVYEEIDRLEKSTVQTVEYVDYSERFVPFAAAGAALLALELLLAATFLRRIP